MDRCTCNLSGLFANIVSQNKLIQILIGLNESYDTIRSQILVLDMLPSVNKAYSMVLGVEKQRAIQGDLLSNMDSSMMMTKAAQHNTKAQNIRGVKRRMTGCVNIVRQQGILETLVSN